MKHVVIFLALLSSFVLYASEMTAQIDSEPQDPQKTYWDNVDIYLITLGRNEVFYTGGGHSLLRVNNKNVRKDRVYNWGTFSFDDPAFFFKFYRGTLMYYMDNSTTSSYFRFTKRHFRREYLQDKLALNAKQKARVLDQINYWLVPENNSYHYQFYKNNCSTKVRDIIDFSLDGILKQHFDEMVGDNSPRGYWQQTYAYWPAAIFLTDHLFNSKVDYTLSKWEEMFVPDLLRKHLMTFGAVNNDGEVSSNQPLLAENLDLIEYSAPVASRLNGHQWFALLFGGGLAIAIFLHFSTSGTLGLKVLGMLSILWGMFSGVYGTALPITSFISNREYFHWPINLLYLWPFDFIFVYAGMFWVRGRSLPYDTKKIFSLWLPRLIKMHVVGIALFVADYVFSISGTNSYLNLVYVMTLFAIYLGFVHYLNEQAKKQTS